MQQQATPSMMPVMPSFSPASISTEQIQKYLDENKKLILAIMDNQNLGKLAECAQYQAQLQKNLMYLAAIADAQPQVATVPPQMSPHPAMQPGAYYMQQQAAAMGQQPGTFSPRMATQAQFSSPLQMHQQQQQHLPMMPAGQMNFRPTGQPTPTSGPSDSRGPNKQEGSETGPRGGDGQGSSAASGAAQEAEQSYLKGSEEGK